jgi:hypothetical protein
MSALGRWNSGLMPFLRRLRRVGSSRRCCQAVAVRVGNRLGPVPHTRLHKDADALHSAFVPGVRGTGIVWADLGVLALWAVGGLAVALRRFSWIPVAAPA